MKKRFNRQQRSTARLGLVQMIFAHHKQIGTISPISVVTFMEEEWSKPDMGFMKKRFESVQTHWDLLTEIVEGNLQEGWTLERLDSVLYSICLAATDELTHGGGDAAPEIIVKEYVDLAADFFENNDVSFVNAYLNGIKDHMLSAE
jgi:transcription termination factor NusB